MKVRFPNCNKQESRNTTNRNCVSHCRECRMSLGWSPGEYGEEVELVCYSWSSGYLLIRAKPQARDKWGHLFEHRLALGEISGRACERQASNLEVNETSLQLFLSNWWFRGAPTCPDSRHSYNNSQFPEGSFHKDMFSHVLKVLEVFRQQEWGKMPDSGDDTLKE